MYGLEENNKRMAALFGKCKEREKKMIHENVGGVRTGKHRKDIMDRLEIVHRKLSSTLLIGGKL